jgi:hypothetical protein
VGLYAAKDRWKEKLQMSVVNRCMADWMGRGMAGMDQAVRSMKLEGGVGRREECVTK